VFLCFILHSCCIIVSAVGWTWWDWSLILCTYLPSVLWHCCLVHLTRKKLVPDMTYNVFGGTLSLTQSINHSISTQTNLNLSTNQVEMQLYCDISFDVDSKKITINNICAFSQLSRLHLKVWPRHPPSPSSLFGYYLQSLASSSSSSSFISPSSTKQQLQISTHSEQDSKALVERQ